jgi:ribonuclease BN (tRNA processing enzyme)
MPTRTPTSVDTITYQVGFGDCFLLRFNYPPPTRSHSILIDFGSTRKNQYSLAQVSQEIKRDCGGKLDVVVATHRHKDHVHGFAKNSRGSGTGKVIDDLNPSVVVMPWTEDPRADPRATKPTKKYGSHGPAFVKELADMQVFSGAMITQSKVHAFAEERGLRAQLRTLGDNNLGNAKAMENLRGMGRRTYYAYHKMQLRLARELPGVKVHVLGPPTLDQSDAIKKQRSKDSDEFWHLQASATRGAIDSAPIFPNAEQMKNPVWGRWLRRRLRKARGEQLLSIVRSLDYAMNNTSLMLLFEVGDKRLLFPGDAQYENWMYALEQDWVKKLLAGVDVYKVGHHGSLNATPKSMFELFQKKRSSMERSDSVMHSLLSTMEGVHGSVARKTEVPRMKLVNTLAQETQLTSTADFGDAISRIITLQI